MTCSIPTTHVSAELEQLVARIAAEVVRRVHEATPQGAAKPSTPLAAIPSVPQTHVLAEKVVTLASVAKIPPDTAVVTVPQNAVLTPSAREWLRDRRMTVQRSSTSPGVAVSIPPAFLVATCDLPARTAAHAAAVVRAVPGGEQLPAAGLTNLIAAFAEASTRSGSRGLLLSPRPAAAALIANRTRAVRAVAATDVRTALATAAECRATLLVVDPARFTAGGLQRLALEFAKQTHAELPADLADASRPCGCSRTSPETPR